MSSIIRNLLALSAVASVAVAQQVSGPAPKLDAPCADVVIFMARGNNAPYHDSRTFPFVEATCGKLRAEGKTCDYIEVVFPYGGDYCPQIADGVRNGQAQITAFNKKCPCTHLILNGYSQGAWIMGDILAGPGGCSQFTTGLDPTTAPGNAIAAALLWGDVLHEANEPYNVLDGAGLQKSGRPEPSLSRLNRYSSVLRSYCAKGDPICANGDDLSKHLSYFELYTGDASTWAVNKINAVAPLCDAPTPSPSASSSAVASSVTIAAVASSSAAVSSGSAAASSVVVASVGSSNATVPYPSRVPGSSTAAAHHAAPTSPVYVAPFTAPQPWNDVCVTNIKVEYVYA
ncbi:carbohydrate esterase family 5 protein [Bipolaris maydis]|nr:carbohydrate esterase family 5 protein [Bipolaris maydis]